MADEAKDTAATTTTADSTDTTSAGTQTTENMVPQSRLNEMARAKKAAEDRLATYEAAEKKRIEDKQLADGEFQKVIDDLRPKAERVTALEATVKFILDAEIAEIPEDKRDMIPMGDITTQLAWVKNAKAKGFFGTPRAPQMDAGVTGDKNKALPKLSDYEREIARARGMTDQTYAEWKAKGEAERNTSV